MFVNPEYVEYVVDGRGERSREREEESSAVASLRVELAEALGRLTRAESELAAVAARCDALWNVVCGAHAVWFGLGVGVLRCGVVWCGAARGVV